MIGIIFYLGVCVLHIVKTWNLNSILVLIDEQNREVRFVKNT